MNSLKSIKWILSLAVLCGWFNTNAANYTSKAPGGNTDGSTFWNEGDPISGDKVAFGNTLFINHAMTFNKEIKVEGVIVINASGSLTNLGKNLKVGNNKNRGVIINYGTLTAKKIDIKGDKDNPIDEMPVVYNYDSILTGKLHIGDNPAGELVNYYTGHIVVSSTLGDKKGELHVDNKVTNCGIITAETKVKLHGGEITCGGSSYTPLVEFDDEDSRKGTVTNQNFCTGPSGISPKFKTKDGGTEYNSVTDMITNDATSFGVGTASGKDFEIDSSSIFICGTSLTGTTPTPNNNPLPVTLTSFKAHYVGNHVLVTWQVASELNCDYYLVESSTDGETWSLVDTEISLGNSNTERSYNILDINPLQSNTYYRLTQYDFNFESKTYPAVLAKKEGDIDSQSNISLYPNPSSGLVHFNLFNPNTTIESIASSTGFKLALNDLVNNENLTLDFSNLPKGIYFIRTKTLDSTEIHKLIIQ